LELETNIILYEKNNIYSNHYSLFTIHYSSYNLYSQNSILISGTTITIQKGINISGISNLTIADNGLNKASLTNSGTLNINGDIINLSQNNTFGDGEFILSGSTKQNIQGTNTFGDILLIKPMVILH